MMMMAKIYLIGRRAVKHSSRPRSHGSRSRRLKSAASASHAVGHNHRSLLQAAAAGSGDDHDLAEERRLKSAASASQAVRFGCYSLWIISFRPRCMDGSNDLHIASPVLESVLASFHSCIQRVALCSRPINPRGSSIAKTVSLKMFTVPCIQDSIFQPRSLRLNTHVPVDTTSMCMRHASDNQTWFFRTEKPTPLHGALLLAHESGNPRAIHPFKTLASPLHPEWK